MLPTQTTVGHSRNFTFLKNKLVQVFFFLKVLEEHLFILVCREVSDWVRLNIYIYFSPMFYSSC